LNGQFGIGSCAYNETILIDEADIHGLNGCTTFHTILFTLISGFVCSCVLEVPLEKDSIVFISCIFIRISSSHLSCILSLIERNHLCWD
jgi:hypothetical protein